MPRRRKATNLEGKMYGDIEQYFKHAYQGCEVYKNPRRLLRKIPILPDVLIVPATEANELIAVEAKRKATAASFSQALGRSMEFREFAMQSYIAFNDPIPNKLQKRLETVAPKTGLLARTSDGRILRLRRTKRERPRNPETARDVKQFLSHYSMYLDAEKRARVEGRKHPASIEKDFSEQVQNLPLTSNRVIDHSYDSTMNIVHVTIDDTIDDAEPLGDAVDSLDGDIQELNFKEKYGANVLIDLGSDVFFMCECGHVMAERCRWCGKRRS